jgi:carbon-monoxide dehydrogenase large subunit
VEVDKDTGEIKIQRYVAIEDCGNVINPMVVEGQIIGGIVQGVGQALYEHGIYDESGQLVTGSMLDYAMPRADNSPMIESDRTETPSPSNSLGVKGVGEMGSISSPPAIVNAVVDALADYGVKHIDMPLTSEKIWNIINSNGG